MPKYTLFINGSNKTVDSDPETPLLYVLRDQLGLNGPKYGCGVSQCASCIVLIDGKAVTSCTKPMASIGQVRIKTLEGLTENNDELHVVQKAFIREQAAQCGYCLNGMVMTTVSLLSQNPNPSDTEIRKALQLNLCRCGTHTRIIKAVKSAAKDL